MDLKKSEACFENLEIGSYLYGFDKTNVLNIIIIKIYRIEITNITTETESKVNYKFFGKNHFTNYDIDDYEIGTKYFYTEQDARNYLANKIKVLPFREAKE